MVSVAQAQPLPQVVTDQLIDQYKLDLSTQPDDLYKLVVGSNGALYLRNKIDGSHEKISAQSNGVPAKVETADYGIYYQADSNFQNIVYISKNPNIVDGDSADTMDVFIYNRVTKTTVRIEGNQPHVGEIYGAWISPQGNSVAFYSRDPDFGDTSKIVGLNELVDDPHAYIIYVYNLNEKSLTTPAYELISSVYDYSSLSVESLNSDNSLLASRNSVFGSESYSYIFHYDLINDTETVLWDDYFGSSSSSVYRFRASADDRHYATRQGVFRYYDDSFFTSIKIHDSRLNEVLIPERDNFPNILFQGATFSTSDIDVLGGVSDNGRYVTFYSDNQDYSANPNSGIPYKTGAIMVYDVWTGETRSAFSVHQNSKSYNDTDTTKVMCIKCTGIIDYDISPSDIRFHNNNKYISFDANAWFLDPSIPYNEFDTQPYLRDQFVVLNPFLGVEDRATCGKPKLKTGDDTGIYLWRNCISGNWYLFVLGEPIIQNITGSIVADYGINNVNTINLEQPDQFMLDSDRLEFDLNVRSVDYEGFKFNLGDLVGSCIEIKTPSAMSVRIGKRQIERPAAFNLDTLERVDSCDAD